MDKNNKVILIVEDDLIYQRILTDKLSAAGFEVIGVRNGEEGLSTALTKHPDLILLDLIMPKMDGVTMFQKLQEDEWGKSAMVIVLTNLMDTGKLPIADSEQKGVYEYLVKTDIKIDDLIKKISDKFK